MPDHPPVRWGCLGVARIALDRVLPAMQAEPSCHIIGLASRDVVTAATAARRLGIPRSYDSCDALLADPDIEAVYIPLPNHLHVVWCRRALAAGTHVLCEKPIGLTAAEAMPLLAARDRAGRLIEEAFAIRNHPQWAALRDVITSGEIGELRCVQATLAYANTNAADIRSRLEVGGGALYDIGSYAVAACRLIFAAEPIRAMALMRRDPTFGIDSLTTVILEFAQGHASFTVTTQGGPVTGGTHQHLGVVGSRGRVRADYLFAHSVPSPCRLLVGRELSIGSMPAHEIVFPVVSRYGLQGRRFSGLVRGEPVLTFPLESAIANMRVIDALLRSAADGAWATV